MKMETRKKIINTLIGICLISVVMIYFVKTDLATNIAIALCAVFALAAFVCWVTLWRCPKCGKHLGKVKELTHCPYCGKYFV